MTTTFRPSETPSSPGGGVPSGGSRNVLMWVLLTVLAAVIAVIVFGAAIAAFLFVSGGEESSSVEPAENVTEQTVLATEAGSASLVADQLIVFSNAWEAGDWAQLETIASADAVLVAQEWYTEGDDVNVDSVNVDSVNVDSIMDGCWWSDNHATCEVLYYPAQEDTHALIFQVAIASTDSEARVTDLTFAGDAG
jgi:hypothetical protein